MSYTSKPAHAHATTQEEGGQREGGRTAREPAEETATWQMVPAPIEEGEQSDAAAAAETSSSGVPRQTEALGGYTDAQAEARPEANPGLLRLLPFAQAQAQEESERARAGDARKRDFSSQNSERSQERLRRALELRSQVAIAPPNSDEFRNEHEQAQAEQRGESKFGGLLRLPANFVDPTQAQTQAQAQAQEPPQEGVDLLAKLQAARQVRSLNDHDSPNYTM